MFYSSVPGLYIHIPFCRARCGYCAFVSGVYDPAQADSYLSALECEWTDKRRMFTSPPGTVYIGGGTPSVLSIPQLARLLGLLPAAAGEATCEVNPESASYEKLSLLFDHGITRLSLGVQTFSPAGLRVLERRHRAGMAERAVAAARRLGFPAVSVDLIHGWPGESREDARRDIAGAAGLDVQHISSYALTLDEAAPAYRTLRGKLSKLPATDATDAADAAERDLWDYTETALAGHGFRHYETSNFARDGFICRHNAAIWQGGEYLGLGAGAHSHWRGRRFANTRSVEEYIRRGGTAEAFSECLPPLAKARETAVFWLRLFDGINLADYRIRTGYDFREVYPTLPDGVECDGVRAWVPARLQPVLDGILVDMV